MDVSRLKLGLTFLAIPLCSLAVKAHHLPNQISDVLQTSPAGGAMGAAAASFSISTAGVDSNVGYLRITFYSDGGCTTSQGAYILNHGQLSLSTGGTLTLNDSAIYSLAHAITGDGSTTQCIKVNFCSDNVIPDNSSLCENRAGSCTTFPVTCTSAGGDSGTCITAQGTTAVSYTDSSGGAICDNDAPVIGDHIIGDGSSPGIVATLTSNGDSENLITTSTNNPNSNKTDAVTTCTNITFPEQDWSLPSYTSLQSFYTNSAAIQASGDNYVNNAYYWSADQGNAGAGTSKGVRLSNGSNATSLGNGNSLPSRCSRTFATR